MNETFYKKNKDEKRKDKTMTLAPEIHDRLTNYCHIHDCKRNGLAGWILTEWLNKNEKKGK